MGIRRRLSRIAASLVLCAAPAAALAQPQGHLTPQRHGAGRGQRIIEIEDFTFDIGRAINVGSPGKADRAGKVSFGSFQVSRKSDGASPRLFQAAATGESLETIMLDAMRHGRRVRIRLHDVKVSGYQRSGGTERFTLRPASAEIVG